MSPLKFTVNYFWSSLVLYSFVALDKSLDKRMSKLMVEDNEFEEAAKRLCGE